MGTFVSVTALTVGLVALVYAWLLRRDLHRASRRLDRYNRALFDANDEIRSLRQEMADRMAVLQARMARATGRLTFEPDMTVREIDALHPQAAEVLAGFHLGGCSSCAVDPDDRLDHVCQAAGIDVTDVVGRLNMLAMHRDASDSAARARRGDDVLETIGSAAGAGPARAPNIELSM